MAVFAVAFLVGGVVVSATWASLPDPGELRRLKGDGSVVLEYADHSSLAIAGRRPGPFLQPSQVSDDIRSGFLATEDKRFFEHHGIDCPGQPRDLGEKLREALMATKVESAFSKPEILQAYMTVIKYAGGPHGPEEERIDKYGVADAAEYYFKKDAASVSLSEAAMIVGAANGVTVYNPHLHYDWSWDRAKKVLKRMLEGGYIDQERYDKALNAPPVVADYKSATTAQFAVDRILKTLDLRDQALSRSTKLVVPTTLDKGAQEVAEAAVQRAVGAGKAVQAALVAVDGSGAVRAFVPASRYDGGHGYADERRQIGSVMKSFIYTAALKAGARPQDLCDDTPGVGTASWSPHDDEAPVGRTSLLNAFAISSNIVAVRMAGEVGYDGVADLSRQMQMPALPSASAAAWPLSVEASPLDVARAFLPFSNGGYVRPIRFLDAVIDGDGRALYPLPVGPPQPILTPEILTEVHTLMRNVVTQPGATGVRANVDGLWIGGKTGTTSHNINTWFVGYGKNFVVAVWVGRPLDQQSLGKVFGGTIPAGIFHDFMAHQPLGWGRDPPAEAVGAAGGGEAAQPANLVAAVLDPPKLFEGPAHPPAGQGCRAS